MTKIVSDVVVPEFVLSAADAETIAIAAEMVTDASYDFSKASDSIAAVLGALKKADLLTYHAWEIVASKFRQASASRARDNGNADPEGSAQDNWERVVKRNRDIHGLIKPTSGGKDAVRKAEKREAEKAKAIAAAGGKSAAELKADIKAAFGEATDESIARAKALEKSLKAVEAAEKDAVSSQMKPLIGAANDAHKALMEFMKGKNDPVLLGDYVVLLKKSLDAWKSLEK